MNDYIIQNPKNRKDVLMGFESLLFTIQQIASISRDIKWEQFNYRLGPFAELKDFPEIKTYGAIEKKADADDFGNMHRILVDKLVKYMREQCIVMKKNKKTELKQLKYFFSALKKKFQIGFINLNYDNVILSSLPDLATGFDSAGNFDRRKIYRKKWNFCYHLHGSVHFDMNDTDHTEMHKIGWNPDLNSRFGQNALGRNTNATSEGIDHLNSTIIAGLDKTNQILRDPFRAYYMQLDRLIYESDAILFMGYGFGDNHLNKSFSFIRPGQSKIRKVVVIDFANDNGDGLQFRHDDWSYGLQTTIPFEGREMGHKKGESPNGALYYKKKKILEKSFNTDYPLAVWYNGILEACLFPEKFLAEL